ncbi:surfeit locus protein 1 [Herrania umbratica]|uniref:SURF1-like protein n=1 Tax=Herrania umbratica TaxID=108875 RepID=A0A6J1AZ95_9ROSI|nr:surfeit locus protein 1 [Herrania umbratica]
MASFSKTLTRLRHAVAYYSLSNQLLPPKHWVPRASFSTAAAVSSYSSSSSSQSHDQEKGSTWSRWFLFLPGAITFGLGTWQIFRRQDKNCFFQDRRANDNGLLSQNSTKLQLAMRKPSRFHPIIMIYVVLLFEYAYSVQSPVLVNRGWVPRSWRDKSFEVPQEREKSSSTEAVPVQQSEQSWWWRFWSKKPKVVEDQAPAIFSIEIIGVVRGSEKPSIFVPANDPNSRQWFYVDVPAIAVASGLPEDTLLIEDINENVNPSNPYPVPKDVNTLIRSSVMPQDHLNYTLTWYSLSAAVTFMAFKRLKQKKSRR